jgi:hypothetical protein
VASPPPFLSPTRGEGRRRWRPPFLLLGPAARERARQPLCGLVCASPWPIRPIDLPGPPGTPSGDPMTTRCTPKLFRCPNTIVLYINLYLSTISRLLVMSVISSGTPNNIRSPNHITHITLYRQRTLNVRTLRVRELCRHDRDTTPGCPYWLLHILRKSLSVEPL